MKKKNQSQSKNCKNSKFKSRKKSIARLSNKLEKRLSKSNFFENIEKDWKERIQEQEKDVEKEEE